MKIDFEKITTICFICLYALSACTVITAIILGIWDYENSILHFTSKLACTGAVVFISTLAMTGVFVAISNNE